jgi:large subunit ribosomal protein L37Ae
MAKKRSGSIKRFGVRYGRTVKHKLAQAESEMKTFQECPYCGAIKVKRIASGIWNCRKCKAKFTGKAYAVGGKPKAESLGEEPSVVKESNG